MLPPNPSTKRVKHELARQQTPLRDEFKLNQPLDHDGADSAWERSSIASGVSYNNSVTNNNLILSDILPQPKHHYEISDDIIMQKEEEIVR